jgi:hypothetical protein
MSHIYICLVSGQPIPNLIPLKMEVLAPQRVILLVSPDMVIQADRLEKVIRSWKIDVERHTISPYNLHSARKTCLVIIKANKLTYCDHFQLKCLDQKIKGWIR